MSWHPQRLQHKRDDGTFRGSAGSHRASSCLSRAERKLQAMGGTNRQSERPRLSITFLARKGYSRLSPVSSADGRGLLWAICGDLRIRRRTHLWNTYTEYLRWLRNNSRSLTVVTFNYDFLLEHLFDDIRVRYEYGKRTGIEYDDASRRSAIRRSLPFRRVQVLKLHGSANWGVCRGCRKAKAQDDMVVAFEKSFIPRRKRTCPRCKINPM